MISRKTIASLLLALLVAIGLKLWAMDHPDACTRYLAGDRTLPDTAEVQSGDRLVRMPCTWWIPRQPVWLQGICLAELAVIVVFVTSAGADVRRTWALRSGRR